MALTIERVKVADIRPLEDEYGNQFVSRDYELEANKKYVSELAASFGSSGEPDEPVKLIRDGELFRIKAGNTRVRAMQELGTEECWAVIDDEDTVQSVLETVIRTDKKKKYEDVELSNFVQQLQAFGDDDYVSEVASIDIDKARRVRRARELIGDRAEQLSLDRLYYIPDLEGDEKAIEKLINAGEGDWRWQANNLIKAKKARDDMAAFAAAAEEAGVIVMKDRPDHVRYICRCERPADFNADYMAARLEHTDVIVFIDKDWSGAYAAFYGTPLSGEVDGDDDESKRLHDQYKAIAKLVDESCVNWVYEQLGAADGDVTVFPNLNEACQKIARSTWVVKKALGMFPGMVHDDCMTTFAIGYREGGEELANNTGILVDEESFSWESPYFIDAVNWIKLHEAAGWEPDDKDMREFLDMAISKADELAASLEDDDDDDGDDYEDDDE